MQKNHSEITAANYKSLHKKTTPCEKQDVALNGRYRTRTDAKSLGKTVVLETRGAESGALPAKAIITPPIADPQLQQLIDVWADIPKPVRIGILAMIEAGRKNT